MNPLLNQLQPYPFARLREAMQGIDAPAGVKPVPLHIGEPKHATPKVITDALTASLPELASYPLSAGLPELRQACADWAARRYDGLTLNPDTEILPVLGSREALFAFAQVVLDPSAAEKNIVSAPILFIRFTKARLIWAAATFILPIAARPILCRPGRKCPSRFGSVPSLCSSARPIILAAA